MPSQDPFTPASGAAAAPKTSVLGGVTYTEEQHPGWTRWAGPNGESFILVAGAANTRLLNDGAQICVSAGASGDYGLMIQGLQKFMAGLFVCFGLRPDSSSANQGAPRQDGLVEAAGSAVSILRDRDQVAQATQVDPAALAELAKKCGFTIALSDILVASQQFNTNVTVPLTRAASDDVREVGTYIEKDTTKDLDLAVQSEAIFKYLKDASKKGAKTKKKIKKVKARSPSRPPPTWAPRRAPTRGPRSSSSSPMPCRPS